MNVSGISIQLASHDPQRLLQFYRDVVQLPVNEDMGDHALHIGPAGTLFLVDHSEVTGPPSDTARVVLDLHIDDIDEQQERLEAAGVKFSRSKGVEYWGGVISTFEDPDGNRIQFIAFRPELARPEEVAAAQ
jgi:predicted enzyme related to lactoylglutathione lyase